MTKENALKIQAAANQLGDGCKINQRGPDDYGVTFSHVMNLILTAQFTGCRNTMFPDVEGFTTTGNSITIY